MKRAIRKALAILLSVTITASTIDINACAAEASHNVLIKSETIKDTEALNNESAEEEEEIEEKISPEETSEDKEESGADEENSGEECTGEEDTENESTDKVHSTEEVITEEENTEESSNEEYSQWDGETRESIYEFENYKIIFKLVDYWGDGYNASIKIENTGSKVIHDWYLEYDSKYEISNIWNAELYKNENGKCIIKNAGWNQDIAAGGSVEFGFSGTGEFQGFPTKYEILGENSQAQEDDYAIEYSLENDWGSGFTGKISITNNTDRVLEDWTLEFDFERIITNIWNAEIESDADNHYVIRNEGYNANIKVGQTVSFGINGENGQKEDVPTNYELYTYKITDNNNIALADGKIDKEYMYTTIYPHLLLHGLSIDDVKLADDFDEDGLSLIEEYEYDTDPFLPDTDWDGLSDYDEVTLHHTNPIAWDTDSDGMSDGAEVKSGLNPLEGDSDADGINDGEEIVTQFVSFDNTSPEQIENTENIPSIRITGKGDYSRKLTIQKIENDRTLLDIDAVVGTPYDFIHDDDFSFEESVLTFTVSEKLLKDYELEDLAIAHYSDDTNALELLETTYDSETNSVSAKVTHYSKYMLVSVPDYFVNMSSGNYSDGNIPASDKLDIVLIVDTTDATDETIKSIRSMLSTFIGALDDNKTDMRLGLIEYQNIKTDSTGIIRSHDWYTDGDSFKTRLELLGNSDNILTSGEDAKICAEIMRSRPGAKKQTMLVDKNLFLWIVQEDNGCWVRLSNGNVVRLDKDPNLEDSSVDTDDDGIPDCEELGGAYQAQVYNPFIGQTVSIDTWNFYSDPSKKDTDGDGIDDSEDLRPTQFDVVPSAVEEQMISFNTGRKWHFNKYTAKEIWDAHYTIKNRDYPLNPEISEAKQLLNEAAVAVNENDLQAFSTEELIYIALLDADGIRFYMDSKPVLERENLFKAVYGRDTEYYQQQEFIEKSWKKVSGYEANGYFKGTVLSEADLVFSFDELRVFDIYSVIDLVKFVGLTVISTLLLAEVGYVVSANLEALALYIQSYGVINGVNFYLTLGAANAPTVQNSLMKSLETDATSGYDDIYTLIEFADDTLNIEEDVWTLASVPRGIKLDKNPEMGNNLVDNFPVIDRLENRIITSNKSIDPALKGYQTAKGIFNKIVRDAGKLDKFTEKVWAKKAIYEYMYDGKALRVFLPNTSVTAEQMIGLQAAKIYIRDTYNIPVIYTVTIITGR